MSSKTTDESYEKQFRAVFDRYEKTIVSYFRRHGFSLDESKDLTQETFLSVYKGLHGLRESFALPQWIFTVANNVYRNELRKRKTSMRSATVLSLDADDGRGSLLDRVGREEPQPLHRIVQEENSQLLRSAIEDLPARMRQCVLLRIDQEMKYSQIAAILQISPETVKVHLHHSRKRLREALGDHFEHIDFS